MDLTLRSGWAEGFDATLAYLRFWLAMAFTAFWTVFVFTMTLFGLLIPGDGGRRWQLFWPRVWGGGILWAARCPLEVTKLAPPPQGTGFIYFSNHQSVLDILALFVALKNTPFVFAA